MLYSVDSQGMKALIDSAASDAAFIIRGLLFTTTKAYLEQVENKTSRKEYK